MGGGWGKSGLSDAGGGLARLRKVYCWSSKIFRNQPLALMSVVSHLSSPIISRYKNIDKVLIE